MPVCAGHARGPNQVSRWDRRVFRWRCVAVVFAGVVGGRGAGVCRGCRIDRLQGSRPQPKQGRPQGARHGARAHLVSCVFRSVREVPVSCFISPDSGTRSVGWIWSVRFEITYHTRGKPLYLDTEIGTTDRACGCSTPKTREYQTAEQAQARPQARQLLPQWGP